MKIGLFFGSFNPIHMGHLSIAQYILNETEIESVHFVVSPQNPFKDKDELMQAELRLEMVRESISDNPRMKATDIEFNLPLPSYTVQTLTELSKVESPFEYSIVMGSDTLEDLPKWKSVESILAYPIIVFKRKLDFKNPFPDHPNITILDNPILNISSTLIRKMIAEKKEIKYLVRDEILNLLNFN